MSPYLLTYFLSSLSVVLRATELVITAKPWEGLALPCHTRVCTVAHTCCGAVATRAHQNLLMAGHVLQTNSLVKDGVMTHGRSRGRGSEFTLHEPESSLTSHPHLPPARSISPARSCPRPPSPPPARLHVSVSSSSRLRQCRLAPCRPRPRAWTWL